MEEEIEVLEEVLEQEIEVEEDPIMYNSGEGTFNYNSLENKPSINDVELKGNKTLEDLGIQPKGQYANSSDLKNKQDKLTAGNNIDISEDNVISYKDEWEVINKIKIEEDSGFVTCNVDENGEHFAYKEIKILATNVLGTNSGNFGLNLYNHATKENTSTRIYTGVILANPMSNVNQKMIFLEVTKKTNDNRFWIEAYHKNQTAYTVTTNQTSPTSSVADDTIRKIQIYFSSSNVCSSGTFKFYGRKKVS